MSSYYWISLSWFHQLTRVFFRMLQFLQTVVSTDIKKKVSSILQYLQVLIKLHKMVVWYSIRIGFLYDLPHNNGIICSHATLSTQHYRSFKDVALWEFFLLSHIFIPTTLKLSTRKSSKVRMVTSTRSNPITVAFFIKHFIDCMSTSFSFRHGSFQGQPITEANKDHVDTIIH